MIQSWKASLEVFWERRILVIFLFGFSSGLPFLLTLSTLSMWLTESGFNKTTIGLFVITTTPYMFKFLWGPMVDHVKLPFLTSLLGQRRGWALVAQVILIFMLIGLGSSHPDKYIIETALWAFGVTFCSAIQDMVLDAYRIEIIDENQQGAAASATYLGYRMGMLASGAGALFLAHTFSWQTVYEVMAALIGVGILTTFLCPAPQTFVFKPAPHPSMQHAGLGKRFWEWVKCTYGPPLQVLFKSYDWRVVLAFIFFYKIGDTVLNVMNTPFLVELGYSKLEIAQVAKFFGISAMIVGGFVGGLFLNRFGILASLLLYAILQIASSLMFVIQALVGYNLEVLIITMGVENLICGLGTVAFIAYLSSLCKVPHTATHFALLSSFGSFSRILLSIGAGKLADIFSWPVFFTITAFACLPCVFLLIWASHHFPYKHSFLKMLPES